MSGTTRTAGLRLGVLAACIWLGGCAGPLGLFGNGTPAPPFRDPTMGMDGARELLRPGVSTRADVLEILGPATVVRFDSAWEVWVYRTRTTPDAIATQAELVLLFGPQGTLYKSRVRPAYPAPAR